MYPTIHVIDNHTLKVEWTENNKKHICYGYRDGDSMIWGKVEVGDE